MMIERCFHRIHLLGFLVGVLAAWGQSPSFYISPRGNDDADGTADQPFATIARARAAVRDLKAREPDRNQPIIVEVAGGIYRLEKPLEFTPEDSGTVAAPVIYRAANGENPVFSGGRRIANWRQTERGWQTLLPEVRDSEWQFSQLFVNGQRRLRPRVPETGYAFISGAVGPSGGNADSPHDRFRFRAGDLRRDWHALEDVEILIFHNWSMSRIPLRTVDEEGRVAELAGPTWHPRLAALAPGKRFVAENVREALNEPGEWYLDRRSGTLTYIPKPGEAIDTAEIVAPRLEQLVTFRGDADLGAWVEHVHLVGLTFSHASWSLPIKGHCCAQAEVSHRSTGNPSPHKGAIYATGARHCRLERCTISHTGFYGVEFSEACHENALVDCELWDLGAGGVMLGTTRAYPAGDPRIAQGQRVEDCLIAHGGRLHPAAVGVWIGHSSDNLVVNNDITDLYYTGISVGWRWGYGFSAAKRNLISRNHISQIGQKRLSDLGGIYTLGESEGTVLSYNRIHDVSRVHYGGSGIYFDQASFGILVENNLVYDTQDATFTVHWGKGNEVRNNIFALAETFQINPGRPDKTGRINFHHNIIYWNQGQGVRERKPPEEFTSDYNLWWATDPEHLLFADDLTFAEWQKTGRDSHSLVAKPQFENVQNRDFRLQTDSPAIDLGFEPFSMANTGRRTDVRQYADAPEVPATFPEAHPPPPLELDLTFETFRPGTEPPGMRLFENNEQEIIRVTDNRAASGERSLAIVDGPGPGPAYNPHMHANPNYEGGRVHCSFDIFLEATSDVYHEWRNGTGNYKTGPSVRIGPGGELYLGQAEKKAMTLPLKTWITIRIHGSLQETQQQTFDVEVVLPGEQSRRFEKIQTVDPVISQLHWIGWVASGTEPAVTYLDNIRLQQIPENQP